MIRITKMPDLSIDMPDKRLWRAVGVDAAKEIRKRTEKGSDVDGKSFKAYSPNYKAYRRKTGRSTKPNLVFTGRMLGAMARGITVIKNGTRITLSGRQGSKAWYNEKRGRVFFDVSQKEADVIIRKVSRWMTRKNKLK